MRSFNFMPAFGRNVAGFRKLVIAAGLAAAFGAVQAQDMKQQAEKAAVSDGVTTALGLAAGAAELNPLGPLLSMGVKALMLEHAKTLPDTEQPAAYAAAASVWSAASANNLCITAAVLSGGTFAPACLALGVAWGMKTWKDSEHERMFWEGCAMLRSYAEMPNLECIYTPPAQDVAAVRPDPLVAVHTLDSN